MRKVAHPNQSSVGPKGRKKALGATFRIGPNGFFMTLWLDSLESYWWEVSQPIGPQGRRKGLLVKHGVRSTRSTEQ
jgi:hypothetical protein